MMMQPIAPLLDPFGVLFIVLGNMLLVLAIPIIIILLDMLHHPDEDSVNNI